MNNLIHNIVKSKCSMCFGLIFFCQFHIHFVNQQLSRYLRTGIGADEEFVFSHLNIFTKSQQLFASLNESRIFPRDLEGASCTLLFPSWTWFAVCSSSKVHVVGYNLSCHTWPKSQHKVFSN